MIGNDIVDLQVALKQSNWQRRGFIEKLFTKGEHNYILNSTDPSAMVWLLWSMKESAYKAYVQKYPKRFFNPKKIICELNDENSGTVLFNDQEYKTVSQISKSSIHTIATERSDSSFLTYNRKLKLRNIRDFSDVLKKEILNEIARINQVEITLLEVKKNYVGVPGIYQSNTPINISFSLSHHGDFGAYAILN